MSGRKSETLGRGSWYLSKDLSLDFETNLQIHGRCSWTRYLIARTLAEDLRTSRQTLKTQTLVWISRSSAEV